MALIRNLREEAARLEGCDQDTTIKTLNAAVEALEVLYPDTDNTAPG